MAIITPLEKKGKDTRYIENWRHISLINVDVKTASKVIRAKEVGTNSLGNCPLESEGFYKGKINI